MIHHARHPNLLDADGFSIDPYQRWKRGKYFLQLGKGKLLVDSSVGGAKRQATCGENQNGGVKVNWSLDRSLISRFSFGDRTRSPVNIFDRVHLPPVIIPPEANAFLLAVHVVARRFLLPIFMPAHPCSYGVVVVVHPMR
jgi:hypothetical protein